MTLEDAAEDELVHRADAGHHRDLELRDRHRTGVGAAARARTAVVAQRDTKVLARREERIPGGVVVRLQVRLRRREVQTLEPRRPGPRELLDGGVAAPE